MNRAKLLYVLPILSLFIISCGKPEKEFNKSTWNETVDMDYLNRECMVNDLMKNHLKNGMHLNQVITLLGEPENFANMAPNTIGYEITADYGWDIDPVEGKTLFIELSKDSTVLNIKLEHWHR